MFIIVTNIQGKSVLIPMTAIRIITETTSGLAVEFMESPHINPTIMYVPESLENIKEQLFNQRQGGTV